MSTLILFDGNGDHEDMRTLTNTALETLNADKVEAEENKGLSSNDYTNVEKEKLGSVAFNATGDQTGAEIKSLYEGEDDTNAFTDAYKATLDALETSNNLVIINLESELPNQTANTWTSEAGKEYRFGTKVITDRTAIISAGVVLSGATQFAEVYEYTGVDEAFRANDVSWEMRDFGYRVPNGTVFEAEGGGVIFINSSRCYECKHVGHFYGNVSPVPKTLAFSNSVFVNIKETGAILEDYFTQLTLRGNFMIASGIIDFLDWRGATFENMEILNLEPRGALGCNVLVGDAGSVNILNTATAAIRDSNLNFGDLNPLGGGLTPEDTGYSYSDAGLIDSKVIGHCYVTTPATTNITAGVETPIAGTYTQGSTASQTESTVGGVITMRNRVEKHGGVITAIDISKIGGGTDSYTFRVKKIPISTGVEEQVEGAQISRTMSGGSSAAVTFSAPVRFIDGDRFFVTAEGSTNDDIDANTVNFEVKE